MHPILDGILCAMFIFAIAALIVYIQGIPLALQQDECDRLQKLIDEQDEILKGMKSKHRRPL